MSVASVITVAAGAFAAGHLGELTRIIPFELADAVLGEVPGATERRVRLLPSRVGLYFLLAMCLFPKPGYLGVWGKLTAGLRALGLPGPSGKALRDVRRRIGTGPVRRLFEILAGPPGEPRTARRLLHLLDKTMLLLTDRGFDGADFLAAVAAKAEFLARLNANRRPPVFRY